MLDYVGANDDGICEQVMEIRKPAFQITFNEMRMWDVSCHKWSHYGRVQANDFDSGMKSFQLFRRTTADIDHSLTAAASHEVAEEGVDLMLMHDGSWRINEVIVIETDIVVSWESSVHGSEVVLTYRSGRI